MRNMYEKINLARQRGWLDICPNFSTRLREGTDLPISTEVWTGTGPPRMLITETLAAITYRRWREIKGYEPPAEPRNIERSIEILRGKR